MSTPRPAHPRYLLAQQLAAGTRSISSIKFSTKGSLCAAASSDGTVRLHTVTPSPTAPLSLASTPLSSSHETGVNDVAFSSDDRLLCTASDDKTLLLHDMETSSPVRTLRGHSHYVFTCCFSPTSALLLSGSYDETIKLWDLRQQKPARTITAHTDGITSIDCNQHNNWCVSASYDGLCRVWDILSGSCLKTIYIPPPQQSAKPQLPPVSSVRITPNGKFLLASYLDGSVRLWDYQGGGGCVKVYEGHVNERYCCASAFLVTHKRKYAVAGSEDGKVYLWDIQSKEVVQKVAVAAGETAVGGGGAAAEGVGVCLGVTCHPTRHVLVSSVTGDVGQKAQLSVFVDNETETVTEDDAQPPKKEE